MTREDILENPDNYDLTIETIGKCTLVSPMKGLKFVNDTKQISLTTDVATIEKFVKAGKPIPALEAAGPREMIYHDPSWTRALLLPAVVFARD